MNAHAELPSPVMTHPTLRGLPRTGLRWLLWLAFNAFALYLVVALYAQGQIAFALLGLVVCGLASYLFINRRLYAQRYIFPSVAGMLVFVIFPLLYTVGIGFTNYSGTHLLSQAQVERYHLSQTYLAGERFRFSLHHSPEGERMRVDKGEAGVFVSPPLTGTPEPTRRWCCSHWSRPRHWARCSRCATSFSGARRSSSGYCRRPTAVCCGSTGCASRRGETAVPPAEPGVLVDTRTGERLTADPERGFYIDEAGEPVAPGFTSFTGLTNFARVLTEPSIREPFVQIFAWTFAFAGLTVVFTLAVGLVLASLLQWELVRGKAFYRLMLILPYAVPAFISILVFRGLFNQNFGEINLLLNGLLGIRPDWFSDPALARSMVLIVNTWLGYPYMLLLCMGLLQAIPRDQYEASAIDGAGPLDNLLRITLPQLIKPLMPLLIASFAFNFNNFVLITLLTRGGPDIIGATTPAGTTDLLVSYTYRIAFQDSGQDFALAAAIATLIFILVGAMALLNLKLSKVKV